MATNFRELRRHKAKLKESLDENIHDASDDSNLPAEISHELRAQCLNAIAGLPDQQRAALVLCRDEWSWLTPDEAEPAIVPPLHWRTARAAIAKRPLSGDEAKRVFGRSVTDAAAKANAKVMSELSILLPRK